LTLRNRVHPPAGASLRALTLLAAVAGCGHTDPFTSPPYGSESPFDPAPPIRLTFNSQADRNSVWVPDESGILYSTQPTTRSDNDVCLALLPPTGGSQRELICDLEAGGQDSTDAVEFPVPSVDGRLAFIKAIGPIGATNSLREGIAVAPALDPRQASTVQPVPYTIPGEPTHTHVDGLHWLGAGRLVFIGGNAAVQTLCFGCPTDTVVANLKIVTLDAQSGAAPAAVPGTELASGVSPGGTEDEIYYTIAGDSRVFRRTLSTGDVTVAFDFGAAGVARDVQVAGSRLVAVVGGRVGMEINPVLGPAQADSGGVVHVVDLGSGSDQSLDVPDLLFRRPALSPSGDWLVAEGHTLAIFDNGQIADTTVNKNGDLYLLSAP